MAVSDAGWRRFRFPAAAIALMLIFFLQALSESRYKSPSSDEPPHLASGLSYIETGIFRGNLQHPPLLKELSGLSMRLGGIRWPRNAETEAFLRGNSPKGAQPDWEIGNHIIAAQGPDRVLFWARLPFIVIAALAGILIYVWGRELMGGLAALCGVFLYTTDPTILGQSFMVTMDAGLTAFTVLFLFVLWRYVRNPTLARLIWCGLALGAVLCAKFSALLLLPVAGLLMLAAAIWPEAEPGRMRTRLDPYFREPGAAAARPAWLPSRYKAGRNDPCPCGSGKKYKACHGSPGAAAASRSGLLGKWLRCGAAFFAMCVVAAVLIEALYFFPKDPLLYAHGAALVNADHRADYMPYMAGELRPRFSSYFAVAYLLKEPAAGIALAVVGLVLAIRSRSITTLGKLFLLAPPIVIFTGTALLADQIGVRYIMPVLPFAHLLGGVALAALFTAARWGRWVACALCVWLIVADAGVYPDHLSYFNESACLLAEPGKTGIDGGTKCGIFWLDDSNVDWNQGLKQLKTWLDRNAKGRTIRLVSPYAFPAEIYGIASEQGRELVLEVGKEPSKGLYVVSASSVARIPAIQGASDWLRRFPTAAIVGHALYVYDAP